MLDCKGPASRGWLLRVNRDWLGFGRAVAAAQKAHGINPANRHWSQNSPEVFWGKMAEAEARLPPPPQQATDPRGVDW